MKKIVLWLMSTLTVVVLLFGYRTSTSSTQASASAESSAVTPVQGGTGSTSTGSGSAAGATGAATGGSSSSSGTASAATSNTVTGSVAQTRWGPVQVRLTVAGGKVTNVSVIEYPDNNGRDQEINARALPILVQETLRAQSARIDMVSGATVTSDGYLESLQSALDKAGI